MKIAVFCLFFILPSALLLAESTEDLPKKSYSYFDVALSFGKQQQFCIAPHVYKLWSIGKNQRIRLGIGTRFNYYTIQTPTLQHRKGSGRSSGNTSNNKLSYKTASVLHLTSLNLTLHAQAVINPKWCVGFNSDAIGMTWGRRVSGNDSQQHTESIAPMNLNLLAGPNLDYGFLNSEVLYLGYQLDGHTSIRAGWNHVFLQYQAMQTERLYQSYQDMLFVGVSYRW